MSSRIDHPPGFVPLHERLRRELSERILLGHWAPGAVLPEEVELAAQFGVAVGTVAARSPRWSPRECWCAGRGSARS